MAALAHLQPLPQRAGLPQGQARAMTVPVRERMETIPDREWDECMARQPDSTVFHLSAWSRVLKTSYGIEPVRLRPAPDTFIALHEVKSWLTGNRGVCAPFADACPVLAPEGTLSEPAFRACVELGKSRGWRHLEFRGGTMGHPGAEPSCRFFQHTLDLRGGETALFDGLSSATRRNVRKAQQSGLVIGVETSEQAMRAYYRLHVGTRAKHGAPPQPESFFLNLWREWMIPGNGLVVVAKKQDKPVAAAVFLKCGDRAVYKFGASDESEQELRPSNGVMWEAIRALASSGCVSLDFGRTSLNGAGLRRFKEGWGARESNLSYYRYDLRAGRWVAGEDRAQGWQGALLRKVPARLQQLIGARLYRHLD